MRSGFFVAGQLTISACPRLLVQGGFKIAFNEAAFIPNGRAADRDSSGNIVIAETAVGGVAVNLGRLILRA